METLELLIETLEKSVEKNGEKPLTNKWLLNILLLVQKEQNKREERSEYSGYDHNWT